MSVSFLRKAILVASLSQTGRDVGVFAHRISTEAKTEEKSDKKSDAGSTTKNTNSNGGSGDCCADCLSECQDGCGGGSAKDKKLNPNYRGRLSPKPAVRFPDQTDSGVLVAPPKKDIKFEAILPNPGENRQWVFVRSYAIEKELLPEHRPKRTTNTKDTNTEEKQVTCEGKIKKEEKPKDAEFIVEFKTRIVENDKAKRERNPKWATVFITQRAKWKNPSKIIVEETDRDNPFKYSERVMWLIKDADNTNKDGCPTRGPKANTWASFESAVKTAESGSKGDLESQYNEAIANVKKAGKQSNDDMLKLYGYFTQVKEGDQSKSSKKAGGGYAGSYKYAAWGKCEGMSKEEAMNAYIAYVEELIY